MQKSPCVFIVGAGPGDSGPDQRSRPAPARRGRRRGLRPPGPRPAAAIARRPDAEKIDVGPAAPRPLDQDAISLLLVEKAREGKTVVRLKWGDPFVFDSGGKERCSCTRRGFRSKSCRAFPGPSPQPAYAGIPITYPGSGDVVTLVRGNEAETDAPPKVDWARLAGIDGTLVSYAGRGRSTRLPMPC
jgi:siroheme synthase